MKSISKQISFALILCLFSSISVTAQNQKHPKLIVLLTIDQLRYDYISKYWARYGDGGFKKLVSEGFYQANTHFSYMPTFTGVGHATLGTGTTPAIHGIAANNWYDRVSKKKMYCVSDEEVNTIGSKSDAGKYSPKNLRSSTFAEQLKMANSASKTIGIAIKDRGAILPVGHFTDGAYWFDSDEAKFITSSFYRSELPKWANEFNQLNLPKKYLDQDWNTLYPIETYTVSTADDVPFEKAYKGEEKPVFPHKTKELSKANGLGMVKNTPYGNTFTVEFAKKAIIGEDLGKDKFTDFLSISFSSTDYIGHQFGPHSIEIEDTYLRLDQDLANLIQFLETQVGQNEFLIVLTSDHGAADIPAHVNGSAQYFKNEELKKELEEYSELLYQVNLIEAIANEQVYIDYEQLNANNLDFSEVKSSFMEFLKLTEGIVVVSDPANNWCIGEKTICERIANGYHSKRSGDLFFVIEPGWLGSYNEKGGTTHGSPFSYDTHVPLIWYGFNTKAGIDYTLTSIKDIAPTLSTLLGISSPNGATGMPISNFLNSRATR
tara:strand:+ start:4781 stop:6421 length:1641 start_codon:yes stop_codon:yes gene_type:complete